MNSIVHFDQLSREGQLDLVEQVARKVLGKWGLPEDSELKLLSLSENATFRVDTGRLDRAVVMRVHRPGYHSRDAVRTELAWMAALQEEADILTPQAIPTLSGDYVVEVEGDGHLIEDRFVDLFGFIEGAEPEKVRLKDSFQDLGRLTARLHEHAKTWQRPVYFERLIWDFDGCLGDRPNWGDWREAPGLDERSLDLLEEASETIRARLEAFGKGSDRYGLIHSDLRLANLLEKGTDIRVIDFDDCGSGWFLYDLASAISFIETRPDVPELVASWLSGYSEVTDLSQAERSEIPTFIMLRRMTLLAWIGSHPTADMAVEQGVEFANGTVELARAYLSDPQSLIKRKT
ncbi:phosphotransferase enzyme family protein [Marinobacter salexigens]|uniref:Phosphotransferase n=1 Tax=Marinobacter salexigens TaxID=1925763 RepID=A0ABS6ADF7_9GAMM|nr:phosphotransferase [Marinobacter salexigens]MBU2875288.1 phosphotransferase [Marinobacter salexigens]